MLEPTAGGLDFGFKNPFAALWGHVDYDDVLWITGTRYVRQCTLPVHAEAIPRGPRYYCDPAQPELIAQLHTLGHDAIACVHRPTRGASGEARSPKMSGIDLVSQRIREGRLKIVRSACLPLVRELSMYHYDPESETEEPVKEDDHLVDALRYLIVGIDRNRSAPAVTQAKIDRTYAELERQRLEREAQQAADEEAARDERLRRQREEDPFGE